MRRATDVIGRLAVVDAAHDEPASSADETAGLRGDVLGVVRERVWSSRRSVRPVLHPDLIRRAALLDWFAAHRVEPVVAIFAPAGYGKTTLLAQVAKEETRPFAWVGLEDRDNDPVALTEHLLQGLDRIAKVARDVFAACRSSASPLSSSVVAPLGAALASIQRPSVIVLDDVHLLHDRDCLEVLAAVCDYVPEGSQLVLAGRAEPQLGLGRLRAARKLAELGGHELALDTIEADALMSAAGVDLSGPDVAELTRLTEGWAAGLYLIALSLRREDSLARGSVAGST